MDQMNMNNGKENMCDTCGGEHCRCPHHKVGGGAIALIGVSFLLVALGFITPQANAIIWPILLIIAACGKFCRCRGGMGMK